MEGPSLQLAREQLQPFKRKKILAVSGNTTIGKERLLGCVVVGIFSWGKHLVFQFKPFAMRVHFLLYGTFEAVVDDVAVTGDYKRARVPRLQLTFSNGTISLFNCSIKFVEDKNAKDSYDFSIDIMSPEWDASKAYKRMKKEKGEEIADILLNQEIFSGVGNIIKNEVLSIVRIHPKAHIENLSPKKIKQIIDVTQRFSHQFYAWRKEFVLRKHYTIYQKGLCPHCNQKVTKGKTGRRDRWSFYCESCQKRT